MTLGSEMLSTSADNVFTPHLIEGERLLWSDQPDQRFFAENGGLGRFAVLWLVALLAIPAVLFRSHDLYPLIIACLGGLAELIRLFYTFRVRSHTYYGLTDKRIMLLQYFPRYAFQDLALLQLGPVEVKTNSQQVGSLQFVAHKALKDFRDGLMGGPKLAGFYTIHHARAVFDLIKAAEQVKKPLGAVELSPARQ
jgi:hypothetical protein